MPNDIERPLFTNNRNLSRKVLLVLDSQFKHWKGTQRFLYEFGLYLILNGFNVVLIENSNSTIPDIPVKNDFEIPFRIIGADFKKFLGVSLVPSEIIIREKPDLVYAVNLNSLPFIVSKQYKTIFGTHVLNISELKYSRKSEILRFNMKRFFFIVILKLVWRNKKIMIHALNTDQRDWISKVTKNKFPVEVIGNPVDCKIDANIAFLNNLKKNDKFTILFFGSFSRRRGFSEFLSIIKYIQTKQIDKIFHFVIAGGGPLQSKADEIVKIYENITLLIRPTDDQKREIMLSSDLFVFPSVIETYSITAVEAQSSGLPSLFSDVTPLKNIVVDGKTGYCLSLTKNFEQRFFEKILEYLQLWEKDYEEYKNLRIKIAESTRNLCKENILPQLLDMVERFIREGE